MFVEGPQAQVSRLYLGVHHKVQAHAYMLSPALPAGAGGIIPGHKSLLLHGLEEGAGAFTLAGAETRAWAMGRTNNRSKNEGETGPTLSPNLLQKPH